MASYSFTHHPSVSPFAIPPSKYISTRPENTKYAYIATGALVFSSFPPFSANDQLRILLIQRAATDSMPSLWEIPGGACSDAEDKDILHGVVRELWEETGLIATRVGPRVGGDHIFETRSGKVVGKFSFVVEVEDGKGEVKLDPKEHEKHVWATEEEAKIGKVGEEIEVRFTTREQREVVLEGFKVWRGMEVKGAAVGLR